MKRGLRVKTGVRAPARLDVNGLIELTPSQLNMTPLVPLIRCTMPKPCGVCWYCNAHEQQRKLADSMDDERAVYGR